MHRLLLIHAMAFAAALVLATEKVVAGAERYIHPANAFSIEWPKGWQVQSTVDRSGFPVYGATPDGKSAKPKAGLWIFAVPIATDQGLDETKVARLVGRIISGEEPGLTFSPETVDASGVRASAVKGTHSTGGAWEGTLRVLMLSKEFFVAACYGAPPDRWPGVRESAEAALKTLVAPVNAAIASEPNVPEQLPTGRDLSGLFSEAVPLLRPLGSSVKDPSEVDFLSYGSGFFVSPEGHVLTNRHVVEQSFGGKFERETFDPVLVSFDHTFTRETYTADVLAVSYQYDLALLKIRENRPWKSLPAVNFDNVRRGDPITVVGWPAPETYSKTDLNQNDGTITAIEHDPRGRAVSVRHGAQTTAGNSGGPIFDRSLAGVAAVHSSGFSVRAHGIKTPLYHGAVPINLAVREFPQIFTRAIRPVSTEERPALIAFYFLQERYGAAMLECRRLLEESPGHPVASAYIYRMQTLLGSPAKAEAMLEAGMRVGGEELTARFAARSAVEQDNLENATRWTMKFRELAPEDVEGFILRGYAQLIPGNWDAAIKDFKAAIKKAGGIQPEAESAIACALINRWLAENAVTQIPWKTRMPAPLLAEAKGYAESSFDTWPAGNWPATFALALLEGFEGDPESAARRAAGIANIAYDNPDAKIAAAFIYLLLGDYSRAWEELSDAQSIRSTPRAYLLQGWAMLQEAEALNKDGDRKGAADSARTALQYYRVAVELAPKAHWAVPAGQVIRTLERLVGGR